MRNIEEMNKKNRRCLFFFLKIEKKNNLGLVDSKNNNNDNNNKYKYRYNCKLRIKFKAFSIVFF